MANSLKDPIPLTPGVDADSEIRDGLSPVEFIATDDPTKPPRPGIALCLSGGGYRAMLFHVGALIRLNELGLLPTLDRLSSVSGGSITAGVLGLKWKRLNFQNNVAINFQGEVIEPIRRFAAKTIDVFSVLGGLVTGGAANRIAHEYRTHLFGNATLQDLPDPKPRFVINATNVQSKALWRFSRPYMWDWRVGKVENPKIELATAVAASSAFPPVLSPLELPLNPADFKPNTGKDLQREPFTSDVVLTDGGVYDNLGLETAWKEYDTIWVSDAGGMYGPEEHPHRDPVRHTLRILDLLDNQVRSLRKRQVIGSYKSKIRKGAYWSIWEDIAEFKVSTPLVCPLPKTQKLAGIATRLEGLDSEDQEMLINWGYAISDAAMRMYGGVDPTQQPKQFPYPEVGVG
jgi:NTE family protein